MHGFMDPHFLASITGDTYGAKMNLAPSGKTLSVMVAPTPGARAIGLSNTPDLDNHDGLLMTWPANAGPTTLQNSGVNIPLDAHWFDSSGLWVDHAQLLPDDPTPVTGGGGHRYLLETNANNDFGIGPGTSMTLGEDPE
jgi:uncharacterized membrane protein (UPF0127 family)